MESIITNYVSQKEMAQNKKIWQNNIAKELKEMGFDVKISGSDVSSFLIHHHSNIMYGKILYNRYNFVAAFMIKKYSFGEYKLCTVSQLVDLLKK
jgi:menaquinone-dependent protoporphyrinogen IX oxidase